jgi:N6-adenosine-specific RNA methylase IME4
MTNNNAQGNAPYKIGIADPPWQGQSGEKHYGTMSQSAIVGMGEAVKSVMDENSWMLMWTTKGLIPEAIEVLHAWGYTFNHADLIVWGKLNHFGFGGLKTGVRRATEYLLVGVRGQVQPAMRNIPDWFAAPVGPHSVKPFHQYGIAESLTGRGVRGIEFFARHRQPGWDQWGDDPAVQPTSISLATFGYPVPSDFPEENGRAS